MRSIEMTGRTVEEAVELALKELGARQEDVEVVVLDEGSKGLFGLLGAKQARVQVTLRHSIEGKVEAAAAFLEGLLERMGIEATVEREIGPETLAHLHVRGRRLGSLIGRRGQTLDAVQYLVNLVANKEEGVRARIVVDAEGYREKRAEVLRDLARRVAQKAKSQGKRTAFDPMSALERRVVHMALADDDEVETISEGEEPYRRVIVIPKRG